MPIVLKSGSLNLLEPSGPVHACNGIALLCFNRSYEIFLLYFQQKQIDPLVWTEATGSLQLPQAVATSPSCQHSLDLTHIRTYFDRRIDGHLTTTYQKWYFSCQIFLLKVLINFSFLHACYMSCPRYLEKLDHCSDACLGNATRSR